MAAGKYRHRIRIEAPQRTTDADGQQVLAWPAANALPFAQLWASVEITGGDQQTDHRQQQHEVTAVIETRSTAAARSVTPGMRARFRFCGRELLLQIASVEDAEFRRREIIIRATAKRDA